MFMSVLGRENGPITTVKPLFIMGSVCNVVQIVSITYCALKCALLGARKQAQGYRNSFSASPRFICTFINIHVCVALCELRRFGLTLKTRYCIFGNFREALILAKLRICFVKLNPSRNGKITLSLTDIRISCTRSEFLTSKTCLLMLFAKISEFTVIGTPITRSIHLFELNVGYMYIYRPPDRTS